MTPSNEIASAARSLLSDMAESFGRVAETMRRTSANVATAHRNAKSAPATLRLAPVRLATKVA